MRDQQKTQALVSALQQLAASRYEGKEQVLAGEELAH